MIIIYTRAYNAEQTLRATIESVLNQTYTDFHYLLFNNGSLDNTLDIMKEYAAHDNRITIFSENFNQRNFSSCTRLLEFAVNNFSEEDYLCNIDADDTYHPDFMERMIDFVTENQLDTAFCGYNIFERDSSKLLLCKKLADNLVIEHKDFAKHFITYRPYTADMWGKLFKITLLNYYFQKDRFDVLRMFHHSQQNFIYDVLANSARMGVLSETLMNYYETNAQLGNKHQEGLISVIQARHIFYIMERFLKHFDTSDDVYQRNRCYAYAIYHGNIKYLISIIEITNALTDANKMSYLFDIFTHHITREMLILNADEEFYSLSPESKLELCNKVILIMKNFKEHTEYKPKIDAIVSVMKECGVDVSFLPA